MAQFIALQTSEQEVAGSIPCSANILSMDSFLCQAVRCFDNGHVGKQPVAWKEYCPEYWFKEL